MPTVFGSAASSARTTPHSLMLSNQTRTSPSLQFLLSPSLTFHAPTRNQALTFSQPLHLPALNLRPHHLHPPRRHPLHRNLHPHQPAPPRPKLCPSHLLPGPPQHPLLPKSQRRFLPLDRLETHLLLECRHPGRKGIAGGASLGRNYGKADGAESVYC